MTKRYCIDARTATNHFPGIGRYVHNLVAAMPPLLTEDEELIVIVGDNGSDVSNVASEQMIKAGGNKLKVVHSRDSVFSFSQLWRVPRLLKKLNISVYHSPYYLYPYWLSAPIVVTVHDLIPEVFPQYVSMRARIFFKKALSFAAKKASAIIVASDATGRDLLKFHPSVLERKQDTAARKLSSVPYAPEAIFEPQPGQRCESVRQKYGLDNPFFLFVGINKPHKNLEALIKAFKEYSDGSHAPADLVIAGPEDSRYAAIRESITDLDLTSRVKFVGRVPEADLPALYAAALAFVFPSLYEGFGFPVIEAMACGAAVICGDVSSLTEVGGDAAIRVDPRNYRSIAEAMSKVSTDRAFLASHQEKSLKQAAKFSWEKTAQKTLNVYRAVLSNSSN